MFSQMVDPKLEGKYPVRGLYQALAIAAMCVQEQPNTRPVITDVVAALDYIASQGYNPTTTANQTCRSRSPDRSTRGSSSQHATLNEEDK